MYCILPYDLYFIAAYTSFCICKKWLLSSGPRTCDPQHYFSTQSSKLFSATNLKKSVFCCDLGKLTNQLCSTVYRTDTQDSATVFLEIKLISNYTWIHISNILRLLGLCDWLGLQSSLSDTEVFDLSFLCNAIKSNCHWTKCCSAGVTCPKALQKKSLIHLLSSICSHITKGMV